MKRGDCLIKDKFSKLFKGDGDNKKKIENLVFLLIVLVITIIAINSIWGGSEDKKETTNIDKQLASNYSNNEEIESEDSLEVKLENILAKMNGVGSVDVMLTYMESTQIIPIYNKNEKTSNTKEEDSGGGTREIEETDISQEVVYKEEDGKSIIATQKTVSPKIEGAIIIAEGAQDSIVKNNIIQAVEAATGLATHKIQVFERKN